jgi:hypothetical protein
MLQASSSKLTHTLPTPPSWHPPLMCCAQAQESNAITKHASEQPEHLDPNTWTNYNSTCGGWGVACVCSELVLLVSNVELLKWVMGMSNSVTKHSLDSSSGA